MGPKWSLGPKRPQIEPQSPQNGPKMRVLDSDALIRPQISPNRPQVGPKSGHGPHEMGLIGSISDLRPPEMDPKGPKSNLRPPEMDPKCAFRIVTL